MCDPKAAGDVAVTTLSQAWSGVVWTECPSSESEVDSYSGPGSRRTRVTRDVLRAGHCRRPGQLPLGGPRPPKRSAGSADRGRVHLDLRVKCRSCTALPHHARAASLHLPPQAVCCRCEWAVWGQDRAARSGDPGFCPALAVIWSELRQVPYCSDFPACLPVRWEGCDILVVSCCPHRNNGGVK